MAMPFTHPARLPTVLSAQAAQAVPHTPQKTRTEGKNLVFSRDAAKHQLNPKQHKLWPWEELTYIVLHVLFRGSELLVIRAATRWVNQPSSDSPDQQGVRDAELNDGVQLFSPLLQELIQHFSLLHRAWEAVQEEAVLAGRGVKVVLNQLHHHLITHLRRGETDTW